MPNGYYKATGLPIRQGKKFSEKSRQKMSLSQKGNKNSLGRVLSESTKEKVRLANLGENNHNWGKSMSAEQRRKISASHKKLVAGGTHPSWRGGVSAINDRIRQSVEYKLWREAVFKRDDYTCVWCGIRSKKGLGRITIEADHIKPFSQFPELRFAIDNGRTLCAPCHRTTDTFGKNL